MGPSEQVALKLARTTKYELGSTFVLSETGFAGPSTALHLKKMKRQKIIIMMNLVLLLLMVWGQCI